MEIGWRITLAYLHIRRGKMDNYIIEINRELKLKEDDIYIEKKLKDERLYYEIKIENGVLILRKLDVNSLSEIAFENIEIDIESGRLLNGKDISKKWKANEFDMMIEAPSHNVIDKIMELTDKYSDMELLEKTILRKGFIPNILYFYRKDDVEYILYDEFSTEYIEYDMEIEVEKDEEGEIIKRKYEGKLSPMYELVNLKQDFKERYGITKQMNRIFSTVEGESIFENDILIEGKLEIELDIQNVASCRYILNVIKEILE